MCTPWALRFCCIIILCTISTVYYMLTKWILNVKLGVMRVVTSRWGLTRLSSIFFSLGIVRDIHLSTYHMIHAISGGASICRVSNDDCCKTDATLWRTESNRETRCCGQYKRVIRDHVSVHGGSIPVVKRWAGAVLSICPLSTRSDDRMEGRTKILFNCRLSSPISFCHPFIKYFREHNQS